MPAQLVALTDGPSILLDKPILLLGRDPECDIQLDSRKVSRRHCCIAQVGEYLVVRDLASTNGIRINGVRVVEGRLKAGDEVTIGGFRYLVRWDTVPGLRTPPSGPRAPKCEPADPGRTSAFLNVRVADVQQIYKDWSKKGAKFLTEPKDHGREIRAYVRDPDGHLIEVGQATGILGSRPA